MRMSEVTAVCESLGLKCTAGPHGVELPPPVLHGYANRPTMRIEAGSGIAGRGSWALTEVGSGVRGEPVDNARALRRVLLEWMTGEPRPDVPPNRIAYAVMNRNRFGESPVWLTRRRHR